jgi:hypothetical protein
MAKRNIRLSGLYRNLKASPTLLITPAQARRASLNNLAKRRLTIGTAHLFYLFAPDIPRLQTKLEMFAKNTLDPLELFFAKQFY